MVNGIKVEVKAKVDDDAKYILNLQERMEKHRLDFIADLYKYTANLVLTYDEKLTETDRESEAQE